MTAQDLIDRFVDQMNDAGSVRWPVAELLRWITSGQRLVALLRPDASVTNGTLTLVAGSKQTLPAGGVRLLDVSRSLDPTTSKPLRAVRYVDRHALDAQNPRWHAASESNTIIHYLYDNRDPKTFYVYPPAKEDAKVEAIYTTVPAAVTSTGQSLTVDDIYMDPMLEYMLFRAYSLDTEYSLNPALAEGHLRAFSTLMGIKVTRDVMLSPDMNTRGAAPQPGMAAGGV